MDGSAVSESLSAATRGKARVDVTLPLKIEGDEKWESLRLCTRFGIPGHGTALQLESMVTGLANGETAKCTRCGGEALIDWI